MTLYSNFLSGAVNSVETKENEVLITYSSNISKEYAYNCDNIVEFTNNLCSVLISNELQQEVEVLAVIFTNAAKILS